MPRPDQRAFRRVRTGPGRTELLRPALQPTGAMGFMMLERTDGSTVEVPAAKWNAAPRGATSGAAR